MRLTPEEIKDLATDPESRGRFENDDLEVTVIALAAELASAQKREQAVQAAALKRAANFARKWNYMACSDVDGLVDGFLALDQPGQIILDEMLAKARIGAFIDTEQF